jgi:hypothetical protein
MEVAMPKDAYATRTGLIVFAGIVALVALAAQGAMALPIIAALVLAALALLGTAELRARRNLHAIKVRTSRYRA